MQATTISPAQPSGQHMKVRVATFMAVFLFYFITTNPFIDLVKLQSAGTEIVPGSNFVNQMTFLLITSLTIYAAVNHPMRSQIAQPRVLIIALLGWFFISSALSNYPIDAIKRTILATLTFFNAGMFLLLPRSEEQFARLMLYGTAITLSVAYFGVIFLPRLSIHQAAEIVEPMNAGYWRGHYAHKNLTAAVMLQITFFGLYFRSAGWKKSGIAIAVLAVFFLMHTGGKSSTAMLPMILILQWIFERFRWTRWFIAVGGIVAFNTLILGATLSSDFRSLVVSVGIDPTFTNRSDIWKIAFDAIGQSPILGYGFQGFWQTPDLMQSPAGLETWAVRAFNGHNAYVDTLLTTGIPGLLLALTLVILVPMRAIARLDRAPPNDPALTRLFQRTWLCVLYSACLEAIFFQNGSPVFFIFLISIFGLVLQSRMSLVKEPIVTREESHGALIQSQR